MSRAGQFLLASLLLLAPLAASAARSTTWDFTNAQVPGQWDAAGWGEAGVTPGADGLHIRAAADGRMLRPTDMAHPVDLVVLTIDAARQTDALFLWHSRANANGEVFQLPFTIPAGNPAAVRLDLSIVPEWDRRSDGAGIALPAGADITLQRIEWRGLNPAERIASAWKSFWTFDTFNATSINFLWGPIVRFSPATQEAIFGQPPPIGWSGNRIFYGLVALVGLAALAWRWKNGWSYTDVARSALLSFLAVTFGLWVFYDIRMGAEFLSYARNDWTQHLSQPVGQRTFRQFDTFYDIVEQSAPVLQATREYGFLYPDGVPLEARLRYFTYPALNVSGTAAAERKDLTTWLVFRRSDVTIDDAGRLLLNGTVLAEGGKIVKRFDDSSFLYSK